MVFVEPVRRPAARVICVDGDGRILLLRWRDPVDGGHVWEPPGGGLDPGERPIDAARRELEEETGLSGECVVNQHVTVSRDAVWAGRRYIVDEEFFLARFASPMPALSRDRLRDDEVSLLIEEAWITWKEISRLPDPVEPPNIMSVLRSLDPGGPWRDVTS